MAKRGRVWSKTSQGELWCPCLGPIEKLTKEAKVRQRQQKCLVHAWVRVFCRNRHRDNRKGGAFWDHYDSLEAIELGNEPVQFLGTPLSI